MTRSYRMTSKRRAALKKAQLASARKRRGKGRGKLASANRKYDRRSRRTRKLVKVSLALGAAGGLAYGVNKHKGTIKKKVVQKGAENSKVRGKVASQLLEERRGKKRKPTNGLRLAKRYRMGTPSVRRKRKAAKIALGL